ncbi:ABC transporter ATP-binding protein [Candidatus Poriferisodalis sp.]|uniref:ABC transporter ATP-binding protein n=1 Tax=Candidatus Poriferisodalis sp. TaxID=3101277 RepID=UPI003B028D36
MKLNTSPPLRARKVSVKYGDLYGVRDVDVDLDPGEILGIIGPNGAGKTSLIECIEGLRKGSAGEIRLFGLDPIKHRGKLAARIGVQLQPTSYPSRTRVNELCELFTGFYESPRSFADLLAQFGLDARRTEYVDRLSGGEQQKLSLVLALIGRPEILFLDELTTGLDPVARRATWEILRTLSEAGTAIVLTSHHMDEVETLCDRVMLLVDGAVRESGTVKHFIDQCSDWNHYVLDANIGDRLDLDTLQRLNHVTAAERQGRRIVLRGPYPAGHDAIAAAVRDHGGDPSQIRHKSPSMEDAFIYLTGLAPEEGSNAR